MFLDTYTRKKELAAIIVGYDVIALQEIKDSTGQAPRRLWEAVKISVDQLIWNRDGKADVPKSITFEQTGGVAAGSKFELEGDPLFSVGEQAIIFFTEFSPGKYRVTGGPTGRFGFQNGRISPVTDDGIKVAEGTTVEQLLQL